MRRFIVAGLLLGLAACVSGADPEEYDPNRTPEQRAIAKCKRIATRGDGLTAEQAGQMAVHGGLGVLLGPLASLVPVAGPSAERIAAVRARYAECMAKESPGS